MPNTLLSCWLEHFFTPIPPIRSVKKMAESILKPDLKDLLVPLPRMTLSPPIAIKQIKSIQEPPKFFGYAVNITREGLFVSTLNPRPVGEKIRVRFELPRIGSQIEGEIEVVWSLEYDPRKRAQTTGMGMRFVDLPEEKKRQIDAFIGATR